VNTKRSRIYRHVIPIVREVATRHGYAIGVHGSLETDLDLIAAPWVKDVTDPAVLADAVAKAVSGMLVVPTPEYERSNVKPHGRRAFTIRFGLHDWKDGGKSKNLYIDLSVMPPITETSHG